MLIIEYFRRVEDVISSFPGITSQEISFEQRTRHIGLIKGILTFPDNSELHFKEFVDVGNEVIKYKYAYHYQKDDKLIFRYDNHPIPLRSIPPHHKHDRSEENILKSDIPDLQEILNEILKSLPQ
jgi:hypothetical protein